MSTFTIPYLLTGVTGGLGAKILHDMLHIHHIPPSQITATSRSETNRERFESQGLHFAVVDYKQPSTLLSSFVGVKELLFISSSERDNTIRIAEQKNVVLAAKEAGVERIWYVSLAFGGYGDGSKISFQTAHYATENFLLESGLEFVCLRAGLYADAFPLFLNWYPSSTRVLLPKITPEIESSKVAFTTREEIGEGIAVLLARGLGSIETRTKKNIVLLTATETPALTDLIGAIDVARPDMPAMGVEYLEPEEWIEESAKDDVGGKGRAWFEARLIHMRGLAGGDAEVTSDALERLLGRKPEGGVQAVERLVREKGGEYTWHQNHVGGKGFWI